LPSLAAACALVLSGLGCSQPWLTTHDERVESPPNAPQARPEERTRSWNGQSPLPAAGNVDEGLMLGVMDKLQQVSELDPAATPQLLARLQETPPEFWPATAEQFRASLAYHQQLAARKSPAGEKDAGETQREASTEKRQVSVASPPVKREPAVVVQTNFTVPDRAVTIPEPRPVTPPSPQPPVPSPPSSDWQTLLELAADDLADRVALSPASTAEVHQHVTLRMLYLMSGQTDRALEPIPGISPMEHDYWSHQLFALATSLDHHTQPDDKRRAAAAAVHFDESLSNLRELGMLSLRNLMFCKRVVTYGVYDPYESPRFSPGQQATLYVEVANFHSRLTDKGFVTRIGSSYEILNAAGDRLAGEAFPDVEDCCRGRRRDFHIQYTVPLPAKIEPGRYRLQLVARDQQSEKIGSAMVEFEVDGRVEGLESRVKSQREQSSGS
jgi:hypothetical protein